MRTFLFLLKYVLWAPFRAQACKDAGWSVNRRVVEYLNGCIDESSDRGMARDYIEAARIVTRRMVELV